MTVESFLAFSLSKASRYGLMPSNVVFRNRSRLRPYQIVLLLSYFKKVNSYSGATAEVELLVLIGQTYTFFSFIIS